MDIKKLIDNELLLNNKLISKKCLYSWFKKNNYIEEYNYIISKTSFLKSPSFTQRLYHIYNNIFNILKCKCGNVVKFNNFQNGYYKSC